MLQFIKTEEQLRQHILINHGRAPSPEIPTITDHSDPEMEGLVREKAKAYQEWQIASIESFRDSVLDEKTEKKKQQEAGHQKKPE
jgi:hypothetical protein